LLPQVEASVTDLSRFNSVVKLVGFSPFKTAMSALENMNSISEGGYFVLYYCAFMCLHVPEN
jgi:nucleolar protein 56